MVAAQHQPWEMERENLLEPVGTRNSLPPSSDGSQRPLPPQHIKVGKVTYTVELVKEVSAAAEYASFSGKTCDGGARKQGVCDAKDRIYLEAGQTLKDEQTALLHELQHAILGTDKSNQETTYHQFIYQLSPKLLEVLQKNPDLYLYLTASSRK